MKKKPILFDRVIGRRHSIRQVIGLMGVHHGAGVTHTGLLLAFYLGEELGKRTAFLECNCHHDLALVQKAYEWSREEADTFTFHKITFYKDVIPARLPELLNEEYECLILDFGTDFTSNRNEFLRCETKIIMAGSAPWEQEKLSDFLHSIQSIRGSESWHFLTVHAQRRDLLRLNKRTERNIYSIPYNPNPMMPSKYTCQLFDYLFKNKS